MWPAFAVLVMASAPAQGATGFDHSAFDALLRAHVVKGMVNYDSFRASPEFSKYLDALAKADPAALDDRERLAYWINVYNAYTIQLVNQNAERTSIRNINKTVSAANGPWQERVVKAGGKVYHLDNVEHDIIRKQWREPRIHFALVCAAMGCPPLRSEAYVGAKLEGQLADQATTFLREAPHKNRVDVKTGIVHGSPIYVKYYREDFGSTDAAIGRYLAQFYPEGPEKRLLLSGKFELVETHYDWTLNSQEQARKMRLVR